MRNQIKTNFKMPDLQENKSTRVIERTKIKEKENHVNKIKTQEEEIQDLKRKTQEPILQSNKGLDKIKTQNKQVEAALKRYDQLSEKL